MKSREDLAEMLRRMDHKSYGMYKNLSGSYRYGGAQGYILHIDHVQGDPYASPSRLRWEIGRREHGFPEEYYQEKHRRLALEDQILRRFQNMLRDVSEGGRKNAETRKEYGNESERHSRGQDRMGSGKSGKITSCVPGQTVAERIAVVCGPKSLELRFEMGFPARGRTILAGKMHQLLFEILPKIADSVLMYKNWDRKSQKRLQEAIYLADDQRYIREELEARHLVAFVADGAILPRESGVSDRPMREAIPFESPENLRVAMDLPEGGRIYGMGIPEGITVIVGGGYHGKSTLLKALEQGVYNHIPGDGREYVISRSHGMKIRAEDGRSVRHTDISLFIQNLPGGQNTEDFTTENASGSTSQAANLIEAMEAESKLLFLDEDTSATNFMIRDQVMGRLVSDEKEPITTLLRHIRGLRSQEGISFVIVVGSSGDYLSVADLVLQMDHYQVKDVTAQARIICRECGLEGQYPQTPLRVPDFSRKIRPVHRGCMKIRSAGTDTVSIDREAVDVRYVEQLITASQTTGLVYLMGWILEHVRKEEGLTEFVDRMYDEIDRAGFAAFTPKGYPAGQPELPRKQELLACISRYRKASIVRTPSERVYPR